MSNEKETDIEKIISDNFSEYANVFSSLAKSEEMDKQSAFMEKLHLFGAINSLTDFEVYILPCFYKNRTDYTAQVRRFDIDGCPIFTICDGEEKDEWLETDWANFSEWQSENKSCYTKFATWEQAAKPALEFIETLKNNTNEAH